MRPAAHKILRGAASPRGRPSKAVGSEGSPSTPGPTSKSQQRAGAGSAATRRWETRLLKRPSGGPAPPCRRDPGPSGCVYPRLPGDGLVVTRLPASVWGDTAAPGGRKEETLVQKAVLLELFCSPLDVITEDSGESE